MSKVNKVSEINNIYNSTFEELVSRYYKEKNPLILMYVLFNNFDKISSWALTHLDENINVLMFMKEVYKFKKDEKALSYYEGLKSSSLPPLEYAEKYDKYKFRFLTFTFPDFETFKKKARQDFTKSEYDGTIRSQWLLVKNYILNSSMWACSQLDWVEERTEKNTVHYHATGYIQKVRKWKSFKEMTSAKVFKPSFWPKGKTKFIDVNFKKNFKNYNDYKGKNDNYEGECKNWYQYITKKGPININ